tara:strand:- start:218 stop:598 length:381 start_codon:yes stop_codon:yes gene_type:complete
MKKIINTPNSPQPIGPYNQAILKNNILFISGQIALDPKTMKLINDSIKEETIQVMENLKNILSEAKMNFSDVVKTSIFLSNMDNFNDVNNVYGSYLNSGEEPARETIAVKTLPMNVNVEISMIAMK